jgi:flagellar hook-basal body complex protein FliE
MKITSSPMTSSIRLSPEIEKVLSNSKAKESDKGGFGEMLSQKIGEVDQLQKSADTAATEFATGKSRNLHETILAMEMADTSLRLMVTVRNKALEAYQEIMRMPV